MNTALDMRGWIARLEGCSGRGRGKIIGELCDMSGWSRDTAYRRLAAAGWESGRRRRSDVGKSGISEDVLQKAGALLAQSQRKDGRNPMSVPRVWGIIKDNGLDVNVGPSQLGRQLNEYGLGRKGLRTPDGHIEMQSLYPNHVHLVDPSLALFYYTPGGRQRVVHTEENYKNKDFWDKKTHLRCWRYVLTDHYSGSVCVKYYQAAGEKMLTLWDFLIYAWGKKEDMMYMFCGLPELLVMDKGSANISKPMLRALESLGVEHWTHKAGAPRAKGSVETMNRHWEGWLETIIRTEPVGSIEELNALCESYCAALNANSFENHDSRLKRKGRTVGVRLELWGSITQQQLRLLPPAHLVRALLTREPKEVAVGGNFSIMSSGYAIKEPRLYRLAGLPGIEVGRKVWVQPLFYSGNDTVRVSWYLPKSMGGTLEVHDLEPVPINAAGFPADAAIWGQEFKRLPQSRNEQQREARPLRGERPLREQPGILEGIRTHSAAREKPVLLPKLPEGTQTDLPQQRLQIAGDKLLPIRPEVICAADVRYSVSEAIARIRSELGSVPPGLAANMREKYPHGLSGAELQQQLEPNTTKEAI